MTSNINWRAKTYEIIKVRASLNMCYICKISDFGWSVRNTKDV